MMRYGAIRQIRLGNAQDTRGTAYVVYEDIYDAAQALTHLSGFNVMGRYLIVIYHHPEKLAKNRERREQEMADLKRKYNVD
jgi:pre-mRNA branch site protein p14